MSFNAEWEWKVFQARCLEGGRFDTSVSSTLFTESDTKEFFYEAATTRKHIIECVLHVSKILLRFHNSRAIRGFSQVDNTFIKHKNMVLALSDISTLFVVSIVAFKRLLLLTFISDILAYIIFETLNLCTHFIKLR